MIESRAAAELSWVGEQQMKSQSCRIRGRFLGHTIACILVSLAQSVAHGADLAIGHAVVVVGRACIRTGSHDCVELTQGAAIMQGDTVETTADGYVYMTTVDKGFISVRPNSSLTVDRYEYDSAHPQNTVIKLSLHKGVVREISGVGARAARDKYRMNTPVAALGIRGTDFSVFTNADVTRAEVRSGGIVMAPIGSGCSATGLGPCEGPISTELFARQGNALLQLYRGSARPDLIEAPQPQLMPDQVVPRLKNEDNAAHAAAIQSSMNPAIAPEQLAFQLQPAQPAQPTPPPPPPAIQPEAQQIFWGRFAPLASLPATTTLDALLRMGSEQIGVIAPSLAMTRTPQAQMVMPAYGSFSFGLQAPSEAYVANSLTGAVDQAQISNAALSIDFSARTFKTSLSLSANGSTYAISGYGGVDSGGRLVSEWVSPMQIKGGLAGKNATQAGYLFWSSLNDHETASGATLWSR
jgi:hypothetical protein